VLLEAVVGAQIDTEGKRCNPGYIYNLWLPGSGYQQAAAPHFERYPATFTPDDPAATFSIYIPVEKIGQRNAGLIAARQFSDRCTGRPTYDQ
jgi:hypothetical protein